MHLLDWLIVIIPLTCIMYMAFHARKYARNVVDFLAAGRVAGRYVIAIGDLAAGWCVLVVVSSCESYYQTGGGVGFWSSILSPLYMILALTGYVNYRWRQTRCLSRGQFLELRYGSKSFRVLTAVIATLAEMVTNAISPAIATNFFIYYLKLPHKIMICGIGLPCYVIIIALCLTLALMIIWPAGRISLLITDSLQGIMFYPIFVMITGFILLKLNWNVDILDTLWDRVPQQSFIDPYDVAQFRDFNVFALVVSFMSVFISSACWIGNDTTNSGRTPHEQKMAGILGSWRFGFGSAMISLIAILIYVFMNSGAFSERGENQRFKVTNDDVRRELSVRVLDNILETEAEKIQMNAVIYAIPDIKHEIGKPPLSQDSNLDTRYYDVVKGVLGDTPDGRFKFQQYRATYRQMMMPLVLRKVLPTGLIGLFALLMVMFMISTDDSRIFNSASCIAQDVILPCFKHRIDSKTHLRILRLTALGVTIFFFIVAVFFSNLDYLNMFTTIMCAVWLGGGGSIMVFGLYTRFGNITGAYCSLIFGSGTSALGLIFQQNWTKRIYPFIESHGWVESLDSFLRTCSAPFEPWIHWEMDPFRFPINSYEIFGLSMVLSVVTYILGSYLTYKPYNLDKLLHRGEYADADSIPPETFSWSFKAILNKIVSITPEYTLGDKIIAWSVFIYTFIWGFCICFVGQVILCAFVDVGRGWWDARFIVLNIVLPCIIGVISTVWFMIGGIKDLRRLFIDLDKRVADNDDNGQVI